jgi:hypothetical protein
VPQPAKRLVLSIKPQAKQTTQPSIVPASLRRKEDISTASLSPEPLLSDDDGSEAAKEDTAPQEEEEDEIEKISDLKKKIIAFKIYTIKLSVILDKMTIYNYLIKLIKLKFKYFKLDAC